MQKNKAKAKLYLYVQQGEVWKYVQEFKVILSEIPDMSKKNSLLTFMDGLQWWVKMEL